MCSMLCHAAATSVTLGQNSALSCQTFLYATACIIMCTADCWHWWGTAVLLAGRW